MKKLVWLIITITVVGLMVMTACAPAAPSEPEPATVEEFYQNNIVDLWGGSSPGGGSDFAARWFAAYWSTVVGGKGTMRILTNTEGGGLVSVNTVYSAKPDGLTMGGGPLGTRIVTPTIMKAPGVNFKADELIMIGQYALDPYSFAVAADSPYESMEDLQKATGLQFGATGRDTPFALGLAVLIHIYGLDAEVITGYPGSADIALANAKGELDGMMVSAGSMRAYVESGWVKEPFLSLAFNRSVVYPDTPTLPEHKTDITQEEYRLYELFNLISPEAKSIFMTPGVPEDIVRYVRSTFDKVMEHEGFQKEIARRWGAFETPISGEETQEQVRNLMATPQSELDRFMQITSQYIK